MEIKTYGVKIVPLKAKCWGVKIFPPKGKSFKFGNVPAVLVNNILTDDDKEDMPIFTAIGEGKETSDRENYVCAVVIEKNVLGGFYPETYYLYDYKTKERAREVRDEIIKTYETAEKNGEVLAHYFLPEE